MRDFKYILFDMDGTLIDPAEGIKECAKYAVSVLKENPIEDEKLSLFVGPPLVESFQTICGFSTEKAVEATRVFRERYATKGIYECYMYEGIKDMLKQLKAAGFQLFVATSKPTEFAINIAKNFQIDGYFTEIVGSNLDNTRGKKAEVIQYILDKYHANKNEVVMIGDREHDLIGAEQMGISGVGVLFGYGSKEELEAHNPLAVLDTPEEIVKYFI